MMESVQLMNTNTMKSIETNFIGADADVTATHQNESKASNHDGNVRLSKDVDFRDEQGVRNPHGNDAEDAMGETLRSDKVTTRRHSSSSASSGGSAGSNFETGDLITSFTRNDVVLGKGNGINALPGNVTFRKFIAEFKPIYRATPRLLKNRIAERVIASIAALDPPGRFLEPVNSKYSNTTKQQQYQQVSHKRALEKTCQALREKKASCSYTTDGNIGEGANANPEDQLEAPDTPPTTARLQPATTAAVNTDKDEIGRSTGPVLPAYSVNSLQMQAQAQLLQQHASFLPAAFHSLPPTTTPGPFLSSAALAASSMAFHAANMEKAQRAQAQMESVWPLKAHTNMAKPSNMAMAPNQFQAVWMAQQQSPSRKLCAALTGPSMRHASAKVSPTLAAAMPLQVKTTSRVPASTPSDQASRAHVSEAKPASSHPDFGFGNDPSLMQAGPSNVSAEPVTVVMENDVLYGGRGRKFYHRPANQRFLNLIKVWRQDYYNVSSNNNGPTGNAASGGGSKKAIAMQIIHQWKSQQSPPGRFLEQKQKGTEKPEAGKKRKQGGDATKPQRKGMKVSEDQYASACSDDDGSSHDDSKEQDDEDHEEIWYEVPDDRVMEKICQALRDLKRDKGTSCATAMASSGKRSPVIVDRGIKAKQSSTRPVSNALTNTSAHATSDLEAATTSEKTGESGEPKLRKEIETAAILSMMCFSR